MVQKEASSRVTHGWDEYYCLGGQIRAGVKMPTEFGQKYSSIGRIGTCTGADFPFFAHVYKSSCARGPTGLIITHRRRLERIIRYSPF